jgi:hypothetical protein
MVIRSRFTVYVGEAPGKYLRVTLYENKGKDCCLIDKRCEPEIDVPKFIKQLPEGTKILLTREARKILKERQKENE